MKVTIQHLIDARACSRGIRLFREKFGDSVEFNIANITSMCKLGYQDEIVWMIGNLFDIKYINEFYQNREKCLSDMRSMETFTRYEIYDNALLNVVLQICSKIIEDHLPPDNYFELEGMYVG